MEGSEHLVTENKYPHLILFPRYCLTMPSSALSLCVNVAILVEAGICFLMSPMCDLMTVGLMMEAEEAQIHRMK